LSECVVDEFVEGERCLYGNPKRLPLCIDDDEDVLECEKSFLESLGYTVLAAASGGKGLELASMHLVDVVIVDYLMPEMNGQEVAMKMRRSYRKPQSSCFLQRLMFPNKS